MSNPRVYDNKVTKHRMRAWNGWLEKVVDQIAVMYTVMSSYLYNRELNVLSELMQPNLLGHSPLDTLIALGFRLSLQ